MRKILTAVIIIIVIIILVILGIWYMHRAPKPEPGGFSQVFESGEQGFSIRYPAGYTVDANYQYQEFGPGKEIGGVSFTIPESMASGTNLSNDTYISVEEIPQVANCKADLFLQTGLMGTSTQTITDDGVLYSFASTTGAAAGNRYEEWIFAIPETNPCMAVRYFIHYGDIGNYPPGMVQEFDEPGLLNQFDAIRRTLVIQQLGI